MADLFATLDVLVESCPIVIDRAKGSTHPVHDDVVYPVDYGYLDGTTSGDGDGIDVFRGSAEGTGVVGVTISVDLGKRDAEVKVLLDCSPAEVDAIRALAVDRLDVGAIVVLRQP
ncbi:hypothetical protein GCM10009846_04300 [Agrococcus versicolor]|uniref:inorganic diphosphatase n=1 Tax=Agrococcus versicolor TaxID=501482 RepID=A0ABN3AJX2_9MICO